MSKGLMWSKKKRLLLAKGDLPDFDAPLVPFAFEDLVGFVDQQEDVFGLGYSLDHP